MPGAYAAPNDVTDQDIRNGIETEFFYAPGVSFHDIKVFVGDGIATLTGTADHLLEKDRAVRIARVVKGVRSVVARIRVDVFREGKGARNDARPESTFHTDLTPEDIRGAPEFDPRAPINAE